MQSTTCRAVDEARRGAPQASTQEEGRRQAACDLVIRQITRRFGPDAAGAAKLASITEPDDLDALVGRVLTAADRPSVLSSSGERLHQQFLAVPRPSD